MKLGNLHYLKLKMVPPHRISQEPKISYMKKKKLSQYQSHLIPAPLDVIIQRIKEKVKHQVHLRVGIIIWTIDLFAQILWTLALEVAQDHLVDKDADENVSKL